MWRHTLIAIRLALVTTVLLGLAYPLAITGFAQLLFPRQANGSLIRVGDRVIGSALIGQQFIRPEYFHPRPSAAGSGYDATASGGSNLGPTSRELAHRVSADVTRLTKQNPGLRSGCIPADMVTTSASGLDPDISPANAYAQVPRVAGARRMSEDSIRRLVALNVTGRQFGVLGEPRVNVLLLNLALDAALRPRSAWPPLRRGGDPEPVEGAASGEGRR
jgi:K+-transporting ATPase ATPase C chain